MLSTCRPPLVSKRSERGHDDRGRRAMKRSIMNLSIATALTILLGSLGGCASSSGEIREALKERYRPSQIELQSADRRGTVIKPGTVLTLLADNAPANVLRVSMPERPHPYMQEHLSVR